MNLVKQRASEINLQGSVLKDKIDHQTVFPIEFIQKFMLFNTLKSAIDYPRPSNANYKFLMNISWYENFSEIQIEDWMN